MFARRWWIGSVALPLISIGACGGRLAEDAPQADGFAGAPGTDGLPLDGVGGFAPGSGGAAVTGGTTNSGSGGLVGSGGSAGAGGSGGLAQTGGTGGGDGWLVGQPCSVAGEVACAAFAQQMLVECQDGIWQEYGVCQVGQNCDSSTGACKDLVTECASKEPHEAYCSWDQSIYECGPDLVSQELVLDCDFCEDLACYCPPGTFGDDSEMTSCSPCPLGTFSSEGSATACLEWKECHGGWDAFVAAGTDTSDTVCKGQARPVGQGSQATAVVINPLDEVVAVAGADNVVVQTYDETGETISLQSFTSTTQDFPYGVAVDAESSKYVGGGTWGVVAGPANSGGVDAFLLKFDDVGNLDWTRQFGGSGDDFIFSVAATPQGGVVVAGSTYASDEAYVDAFVRHYDADGAEVYGRVFGSPEYDVAWDVAVAPSGTIYVAGHTDGVLGASGDATDVFLRKYDAAGDEQWTQQLPLPQNQYAQAVAVDTDEQVYLLFQDASSASTLAKYDALGEAIWTTPVGYGYFTNITVDANGNPHVGGATVGGNPVASKYDPLGSQLWTRELDLGGGEYVWDIAVRAEGQVYLAGITSVPFPYAGTAFVIEVLPP